MAFGTTFSSLTLGGLLLGTPFLPRVSAGTGGTIKHDHGVVAIQAGTIHTVSGETFEGGATVLVRDGIIQAVGRDIAVPGAARVVDYGADAVLTPGLVCVDSAYGVGISHERTAAPDVLAIDGFDSYADYHWALTGGVTTTYLAPARGRLIGGQGAAVKTAEAPHGNRVLSRRTGIDGSISADARNTPGYWEPPVPATVDVGLGVATKQLPRTTMGAVVALDELFALANGGGGEDLYGPHAGPDLAKLMKAGTRWRMRAETRGEIQALLGFFKGKGIPLVIEGAGEGGAIADELAAAGYPVIVQPPYRRNSGGVDYGKSPDSTWPQYETASTLAAAGVNVTIAPPAGSGVQDLRFAAAMGMRGGLSPAQALRAITLNAAEVLGVSARVGSIEKGKDADFTVLNGPPTAATSSVLATWVGGDIAWKAHETSAVVVEVDELHLGDGHVLVPGELLMVDGRIAEVGRRVGHPVGATVVRAPAAMPGMIDCYGHLGLQGSRKRISPRFSLTRMIAPGDETDRRVAAAGVTTVVMGSQSSPGDGSQTIAYKPAGKDLERMIVQDANSMHMEWTAPIRSQSGEDVKKLLEKVKEYQGKWAEYEKELAAWKPTPEEPEASDEAEDEKKEDSADEEKADDDDEDSKKKKKKKKDEEEPARPVTGVWEADGMRLQLQDDEGSLHGFLRAPALSDVLVPVEGQREEKAVHLTGLGRKGSFSIELTLAKDKLTGKSTVAAEDSELILTQTSLEYVVAARPERRKPESESEPKGKPKAPGIDPELETVRRAMTGEGTVVVLVSRRDEILDCVATFEEYGIRPVLFGAADAHKVVEEIKGRVSGVLLSHTVVRTDTKEGTRVHNRYAELQNAGIPVGFHSGAEEGAAQLRDMAAYAISQGMSPGGALRALTSDAAKMMSIQTSVGSLLPGLDADVVLLDGSPLDVSSRVMRVWVDGEEVR